ncbi:peptidase M15 [Kineococcus sp. T13]|nr:peptidase M15 [Kineococcus vitellinus]
MLAAALVAALAGAPGPSPARVGGATSRTDSAGALGEQAVTEADGLLPDGTGAFDDRYPGVADLDPALLQALRRAAADAAEDGAALVVNSGWRSRRYQEQLLAEAVARHGSPQEAARWVAPADTSAHVSGDAVDVGPAAAAAWLSEHGARYGLCPVYRNEPWHFELRPRAVAEGCPATHADPAHDPRVQR